MLNHKQIFFKNIFDRILAALLIIILLPIFIIIFLLLILNFQNPVFCQTRIGQSGVPFSLFKFRTMRGISPKSPIAALDSERITWIGKILRKSKLDELPELWNIFIGNMSFVGPRPDVPGYADKLSEEDAGILSVKPGLTGVASLKYLDEEVILSGKPDPKKFNDEVIFPDKIKLNKNYIKYWSFWLDIKIIIFTILRKKLKEEYFQ